MEEHWALRQDDWRQARQAGHHLDSRIGRWGRQTSTAWGVGI